MMRRFFPVLFAAVLLALPTATASATDLDIGCDFNSDGAEDLAIGVPGEDIGTIVDAGAVSVIYGGGGSLAAANGPGDQLWHQDVPGIVGASQAGDSFGVSLTCGDFDGDGFDDLAIGVPGEDIGAILDAGAVNVIYGSAGGLAAAAGPGDQLLYQGLAGINGGAEAGDFFGISLASSDFDGDPGGTDDLAIGAPREDIGGIVDAGSVNVIHGSAGGLTAGAGPGDQLWHQDSPGILGASQAGDFFGFSLATGDFNGGGLDDLAIGVPGEDIGPLVDAGAVNVVYVSGGVLNATGNQLWHQDAPGVNGVAEADDAFGFSLEGGNFNTDFVVTVDIDDLAIGVPGEDIGPLVDAGAVNVIYGSSTDRLDVAAGNPDQLWHQDTSGVNGVAEAFDLFGFSLASGDYNVDGDDDLAIGAPGESIGPLVAAGAVNVIYGGAASTGLAPTNSPGDQLWHQDSPGVNGVAEAGDFFGVSLASGNFGGSSDDLAIGAPGESIGPLVAAGAVNVIYGGAASTGLAPTNSPGDQLWHQDSPGINGAAQAFDFFGDALGAAPPP